MSTSHPTRWRPAPPPDTATFGGPVLVSAVLRGWSARCPACGEGRLFARWLRVNVVCPACAAPLGLVRADDAPPYFTIFIVAHLAIGALVATEHVVVLPVTTEMAIFLPGTLALTLLLIRPVKGATVGLMMKLGFMRPPDDADG